MPVDLKHLGGVRTKKGTCTRKPRKIRWTNVEYSLPITPSGPEIQAAFHAGATHFRAGGTLETCPEKYRPKMNQPTTLYDAWKQGFLVTELSVYGPKQKAA